jgi:ABC-2 type transport system ATP-binding protein
MLSYDKSGERKNMDTAIHVQNLRRIFKASTGIFNRHIKEVEAVRDVSFDIKEGELFGLLGPNGAGKTTTVKMLTTLLIPTSGSATILGFDVVREAQALRSKIGFIFGGERGLYWRLSAFDNLRYFASLYRLDPDVAQQRIPYLLEMVGLKGREREKIEGYSRGMKQRVHIARMLLHDPQILFLDEPSIGLDPVAARELRDVVRNLQSENKTILLTTHYMFEADVLCDRIAVIDHGEIVALDTPANLKQNVQDLSIIELEVFGVNDGILSTLRQQPYVESVALENREQKQVLLIQSPQGSEVVSEVLGLMNGHKIGRVVVREPTLEDAYVRLVSN